MSNAFSKARDTYDLAKKARALQKELKDTEVEVASSNGEVSVVFNGEQRMVSVTIGESYLSPDKKRELEKELLNVVGQAISKSQAIATEQMKKIAGDLKLPQGLF